MTAIFEASPEGFRSQNANRPPAHLVRELIQNAFDEGAGNITVEVSHTPVRGVRVLVTDDVPGGFRDEKLIFTLWQSDKADVATKRGRMGRGLKEIVAVSDRTIVRTQGRPGTVFRRDRAAQEWSRSLVSSEIVDCGTQVEAQVTLWSKGDVKAIEKYLTLVRPPPGITLTVNGIVVERQQATEQRQMRLSTVIFRVGEDGERREAQPQSDCTVDLFPPKAGGKAWVYEMGLPIEEIEYPLSIDVSQRIPLREQRDTLIDSYRKELFAKLLNARIDSMPDEALRDNHALLAATSWHLDDHVKARLARVWSGGLPFASTPLQMAQATGAHIGVVNLRTLPEGIRSIVESQGTPVVDIFAAMRSSSCPEISSDQLTLDECKLLNAWDRICKGVHRPATVRICGGQPFGREADFDPKASVLTLYRDVLGARFFADALSPRALGLLIHELAHWQLREENHGVDFVTDTEDIGGSVASFLAKNGAGL